MDLFDNSVEMCKAAASAIDQLKNEHVARQSQFIRFRRSSSVEDKVKTGLKLWADIVKQNCSQGPGKCQFANRENNFGP